MGAWGWYQDEDSARVPACHASYGERENGAHASGVDVVGKGAAPDDKCRRPTVNKHDRQRGTIAQIKGRLFFFVLERNMRIDPVAQERLDVDVAIWRLFRFARRGVGTNYRVRVGLCTWELPVSVTKCSLLSPCPFFRDANTVHVGNKQHLNCTMSLEQMVP
jgi:hypothetical protein